MVHSSNLNIPKFLEGHDLKGADEEMLMKLQNSSTDEFWVLHINIFHNKEEDKAFCYLDDPNKEAVEKHHEQMG
jgi:hypothetical protein